MESALSPAKVVLLAVHFATHAQIPGLTQLAAENATVLRQELLLRILLTYLPETVPSLAYVDFLRSLATSSFDSDTEVALDISPIRDLSEQEASKKAKKLHLLQPTSPDVIHHNHGNPVTWFLFERAYRVDEEAGMLTQLPDLLIPFLDQTPAIRSWMASAILPLLRKEYEYYPRQAAVHTLREFEKLPDRTAIEYLLAQTGENDDRSLIGRDLDGLIGPWLHNDLRWTVQEETAALEPADAEAPTLHCPGWEHVLEWLLVQASRSWTVAVAALEQWDGPADVVIAPGVEIHHSNARKHYLNQTYLRAALASPYLILDPSTNALEGAHCVLRKVMHLLKQEIDPTLEAAAARLPSLAGSINGISLQPKSTTYMRNDLLNPSNQLTDPSIASAHLQFALLISAYISTRLGSPFTTRAAGDLTFLQDGREQKAELSKLIRAIATRAPRNDDEYWLRARRELLWLQNWGSTDNTDNVGKGLFSAITRTHIETELLKALLSNSRFALARAIYEDGSDIPLSPEAVRDAVFTSALNAFDNASNPSRTRGGLKRCDDMLHAFPKTIGKTNPTTRRIEALLKATHALSEYRLVLKQGEPFSPVVLRVHSDPISVIEKVLEQNPKAYTRLQEFLEMGINMILGGLINRSKSHSLERGADEQDEAIRTVEKRIVAMCIEAALREDDFETAYSYVVSRLGGSGHPDAADEWSFGAALKAGQYIRTERSQLPTHLGTASGNPEIRHLEQRIECLATALRVAPPSQLLEILKSFRRCEEQLDSAIQEEAAKESAWDAAADVGEVPGAFDAPGPRKLYPPRNVTASTAARQTEEAPMSLFDLSRATAKAAQKNLTALSSLQGMGQSLLNSQQPQIDAPGPAPDRLRKRDQLRDAATERLVSGVGWLIGANVNRGD
ncbi:Protein transport protein sec39 [Paramyrothecium foliicola]|nr:Protein transport protein sec39 [Paramyrothecium foliicola]